MKIPNEAIPICYKYAKEAFDGKITPEAARQKIHEELSINFGSAKDYFLLYRYLITGTNPTWALNNFTFEYFLKSIIQNEGNSIEQKKNSLYNFKKLIEKLEGSKTGSKKLMNVIYEQYSKLV